jgi:hypothetical protein
VTVRNFLLMGSFSLILSSVLTSTGWAQAFGGGESERAIRPNGYNVPYDGMPSTQRYSYSTGSFFYLNQDPRGLYWADYFDRLDRAEKFGYCPPKEPCFGNQRGCGEARFGFTPGWFRLR